MGLFRYSPLLVIFMVQENLKRSESSKFSIKIVFWALIWSIVFIANLKFNRTQDKTVVEFCKTVAATAPFLMPILVPLVLVPLFRSVTDTSGTKIGIKNGAVATTVLQNSATVLSWVLLIFDFGPMCWLVRTRQNIGERNRCSIRCSNTWCVTKLRVERGVGVSSQL